MDFSIKSFWIKGGVGQKIRVGRVTGTTHIFLFWPDWFHDRTSDVMFAENAFPSKQLTYLQLLLSSIIGFCPFGCALLKHALLINL